MSLQGGGRRAQVDGLATFPILGIKSCSRFGNLLYQAVQIVSKKTLVAFWTRHPQSRGPLTAWYHVVDKVEWKTPADIKNQFGANVDFVGDNRAIFDIAGNKYRVIVHVSYTYKRLLIKFVGTHAEYDRIDAETV